MAGKSGRRCTSTLSFCAHRLPSAQGSSAIGEQRVVKYAPAGVYFGDEVDLDKFPKVHVQLDRESRQQPGVCGA